ncbi:hypothetical protein SSX86_027516 [Deinandra increscens subsp. villosa]|uniref:Protein kinase domain-containing protein n=1 Tax=Deinandra increscens subsp. villosa TaxID=3103831 RepID=A0AAP0C687_9ASTR
MKIVCVFVLMLYYYCCCRVQCHGETTIKGQEGQGEGQRVILSILLGSITGLGCALVSASLLTLVFRCIKRPPILKGPVVFSPRISPKSLQSALLLLLLANQSQSHYLLLLDDSFTVSVKRLQTQKNSAKIRRRIQRELEILAGLRHRNLMSLMAYYYVVQPNTTTNTSSSSSSFCLVYDYLPTGSLEDAMRRSSQLPFGWDTRLRIAVGIIKGLHHLHFGCTPRILHYNLKPSNVLLDAEFEPRLGDCGLMHTFHEIRSSQLLLLQQGQGHYYAPECFPNFSIYTEKSDIFSFGVILGMLVTGRDPKDPVFGEVTSSGSGSGRRGGMGMWLRQVLEAGDGREALDKSLLLGGGREEMEEDEMLMAVRIAAVCLSDMPADRPSSDELVPMLTQLHSF